MQVQGVQPGPLLIRENPDVFWGIIASMYVGNVILLLLNLPMVSMWVRLLRVPKDLLIVGIVIATAIGSYAVRNSLVDVFVLFLFGVLGYVLKKIGVSPVPLLLALVLGPIIEKHLLEGMFLGRGEVSYFFNSPLSIVIWVVGLVGIAAPWIYRHRKGLVRKRGGVGAS